MEQTSCSTDIDRFAELVTEIEVNLKLVEASRSALNVAVATPLANKSAPMRTHSPLWTLRSTAVNSAQRGLDFGVTPLSVSGFPAFNRTPGLKAVTPLPEQRFWYLNELADIGENDEKVAEPGLLGLPVSTQSRGIVDEQPLSACTTSERSVDVDASASRRSIKRQHSAHIVHKEKRSFSRAATADGLVVESHEALADLQSVQRVPGPPSLLKAENGVPGKGSDKSSRFAEWHQELQRLGTDASEAKSALEATFSSAMRELQVLYDQLSATKAGTPTVRTRADGSHLSQAKGYSNGIRDQSSPTQQPAVRLHEEVQAENHILTEAQQSAALADCLRQIAELEEENNRLKSVASGRPCVPVLAQVGSHQGSHEAHRQASQEEAGERCVEEARGSVNTASLQAHELMAFSASRPSSSPEAILAESSLPSRLAREDSDSANGQDANRAAEDEDASEGSSPAGMQDANRAAGDKDAREGSSPADRQDANRAAGDKDAREISSPADGQYAHRAAKDEDAREGSSPAGEQDANRTVEHHCAVEMPVGSGQRMMPRLSSGAARSSWDSPIPVLSSEKATSALNGALSAIRQQDSLCLVGQQKTPPSRRHSPLEALVHYLRQEELTP